MSKTIFITGATSGIGKACAERFASANFRLIISGRRADRLKKIKTDLESTFNVEVLDLCFDVQDKNEVFNAIKSLPETWRKIDVLINNAGLSLGRDNFADCDITDWETMLQTNVNGLLYVSKAVLDLLIPNESVVVNIGSIAGKEVYENGNVYCASKFAVDAITKSMRIDLLKKGIRVTAIHPGAVETEFSIVRFKGDTNKATQVYNGFKPLAGDDIADAIFYTANLPSHVCINELTIMPKQQASASYFHKD
jgi:NADP-dependent 3-hydroxy acid dehydrogenase YdfG